MFPRNSIARQSILRPVAGIVLALAWALSFSACRPKPLTPAELESVTGELVQAARKATNGAAEIRIFPAPRRVFPAKANGKQLPTGSDAGAGPGPDRIMVALRDAQNFSALEAGWQGVARAHGLELLKNTTNPRIVRFRCRYEGNLTHSIQVLLPGFKAAGPQPAKPGQSVAIRTPSGNGPVTAPRLAVIIDDLGYDMPAAERLLALPFPLTLAVLPNLPHSAEIAAKARAGGFEVLLHLPMESENPGSPGEAAELRTGMNAVEIARQLDAMLATVPGAAGVSNHQGSRATADLSLMQALVGALKARHLFFIDSRTTPSSVAFDTARAAGLAASYRTEFLDDDQSPAAILFQLERAEQRARGEGWALVIGHPYRATLDVLTDALPDLEARGVRLSYASEVLQ